MSIVSGHGGTAGLVLESVLFVVLVVLPVAALVPFARWLRRREQLETDGDSLEVDGQEQLTDTEGKR